MQYLSIMWTTLKIWHKTCSHPRVKYWSSLIWRPSLSTRNLCRHEIIQQIRQTCSTDQSLCKSHTSRDRLFSRDTNIISTYTNITFESNLTKKPQLSTFNPLIFTIIQQNFTIIIVWDSAAVRLPFNQSMFESEIKRHQKMKIF